MFVAQITQLVFAIGSRGSAASASRGWWRWANSRRAGRPRGQGADAVGQRLARRRAAARAVYAQLMGRGPRPDPLFVIQGRWIVRRLSPQCGRIELTGLPKPHDDVKLLHAMGWETANVHLADRAARAKVRAALKRRPANWLYEAAKDMMDVMMEDWGEWRDGFTRPRINRVRSVAFPRAGTIDCPADEH